MTVDEFNKQADDLAHRWNRSHQNLSDEEVNALRKGVIDELDTILNSYPRHYTYPYVYARLVTEVFCRIDAGKCGKARKEFLDSIYQLE